MTWRRGRGLPLHRSLAEKTARIWVSFQVTHRQTVTRAHLAPAGGLQKGSSSWTVRLCGCDFEYDDPGRSSRGSTSHAHSRPRVPRTRVVASARSAHRASLGRRRRRRLFRRRRLETSSRSPEQRHFHFHVLRSPARDESLRRGLQAPLLRGARLGRGARRGGRASTARAFAFFFARLGGRDPRPPVPSRPRGLAPPSSQTSSRASSPPASPPVRAPDLFVPRFPHPPSGPRLPRARASLPHPPDARMAVRSVLQVPAGARAPPGPSGSDPSDPAVISRVQDRDEDRAVHRPPPPRRDVARPRGDAPPRPPQLRPEHRERAPGEGAQVRARQRRRRRPSRRRPQVPREQAQHLQPGGRRRAERHRRAHLAHGRRPGRRAVRRPGPRPAPLEARRRLGPLLGFRRRPGDGGEDSRDSRAQGGRGGARGLRRGEAPARRDQPPQGGRREGGPARAAQAERDRGGGLRRREGDQDGDR